MGSVAAAVESTKLGASIITYTILGVPYYNYSRLYTQTLSLFFLPLFLSFTEDVPTPGARTPNPWGNPLSLRSTQTMLEYIKKGVHDTTTTTTTTITITTTTTTPAATTTTTTTTTTPFDISDVRVAPGLKPCSVLWVNVRGLPSRALRIRVLGHAGFSA